MWTFIKKRSFAVSVTLIAVCIILASGTFAWFAVVQNLTNEFTFEPFAVRLLKVSSDDHSLPLSGATFMLYNEAGVEQGWYVTDDQGCITVSNLPQGKYYFQEIDAPYGYRIVGNGKTPVFTSGMAELVVTNEPLHSKLTIVKHLSETDLSGAPYTPTAEDKAFPFAFTVTLSGAASQSYSYQIMDADNNPLSDAGYSHTYEDGSVITQHGKGAIAGTGVIYLRDGEQAVFIDMPVGTSYTVREKDYLVYDDPDAMQGPFEDFGCKDNITNGHDRQLTTAHGWAHTGYNTTGQLREGSGSVAVFSNTRVPKDYKVTISSLVVVDRILAHPSDVDYNKGFQVTVEIGDAADDLAYWYEVVHIEDTAHKLGNSYPYKFDYYDRNDPGVPDQLAEQPTGIPTVDSFHHYTLAPSASDKQPGTESTAGNLTLPEIPSSYAATWLHKPVDGERWAQEDGSYGALMLSSNTQVNPKGSANKIVVDLHHASAVIIYGIPVGTTYTTSQVDYRYIDGYILDSTNKDTGIIMPDLEVNPDPDTADQTLRRTRADIYNYFVMPVMRKLKVEKFWNHGSNPTEFRPASTTIQVYDTETNYVYDSRSYRSVNDWAVIDVPKYKPGTNELIDYALNEQPPPGYVIEDITETSDGFQITNTFMPNTASLTVSKRVTGNSGEKDRRFRFEIRVGSDNYTVYLKHGETWTLPRTYSIGTEYRVTESDYSDIGYTTTSTGAVGTIDIGGNTANFVNKKDVSTPGGSDKKASLTVSKELSGNGADPRKRFDFTVTIGGIIHKLSLKGGERYTFYDIPVNTHYTVYEASYTADGYTTDSNGSDGTIVSGGNTAVFTNTHQDNIDPGTPGRLTVTKTVTGKFIDATKRFRFTVTIGDNVHEVLLRHGESKTFEGIPSGTSYSVVEDDYALQDYVTSSTGAIGTMTHYGATAAFTNDYTSNIPPEPDADAVQISGIKSWKHGANTVLQQPQSIVVYVLSGTNVIAQKTVTAADNWSYAFNLPRYDAAGKDITYSVNEEAIKSYIKSIRGYDITNTYFAGSPETGDSNRMWVWFIWLAVGIAGLRYTLFYRPKRRERT